MRELTGHRVNPDNDLLLVEARDEPGPTGICHRYSITTPPGTMNPPKEFVIEFQHGTITGSGVNGITSEALICILIDRLESFQATELADFYNEQALTHLRYAMERLQARTKERMARRVEGPMTV